MAEADQLADENEGAYAFRIEDYDFLNVEEFPNILDDHEESSLQELAETSNTVSYSEALYLAVNMETPGEMPSDDLYFLVPNHEDSGGDTSIYVNLENQGNNRDLSQTEIFIQANLDKAAGESAEQKRGYQADFFRDHVDPDGIVHAVDLDEHDYAVEALHSGFGSE